MPIAFKSLPPESIRILLKMSEDPTLDEEERPAKRFKVCPLKMNVIMRLMNPVLVSISRTSKA